MGKVFSAPLTVDYFQVYVKKNLSIEEFLVLSQLISFSRANGVLNCRFIKLASCTFRTSSILDRMLHIIGVSG